MDQLEPCPRCARHVRVGAPCPFCGAELDFEVSQPLLPNRRLSRFEFVSWKTLVGAGVVGGSISMFASACAAYGAPCDDHCNEPSPPDASDASTGGVSAAGRSGVGGSAIVTGGSGGARSSGGAAGTAGTGASDAGNAGGAGGEQGGEGGV